MKGYLYLQFYYSKCGVKSQEKNGTKVLQSFCIVIVTNRHTTVVTKNNQEEFKMSRNDYNDNNKFNNSNNQNNNQNNNNNNQNNKNNQNNQRNNNENCKNDQKNNF